MKSRIILGLLAILSLAVSGGAEAKFYALVVGIDSYRHINPLHGAVNDARLLADTFKAAGASDVRLLLDDQATRKNMLDSFNALVAKAEPDDWVIMTYAGHGWMEPEQTKPFRHPDGMDNAILLTGFETFAPGNGERIRDFEFNALLSEVPAGVKVLFIADACHSGTLTRDVDPRAKGLTYRNTPYGPINQDELPPEPKNASPSADERPNVVFAAAALDTETAPELTIAGQSHGALSWYVAHAIAGEADQNGDGKTTLSEFRSFVTSSVRTASESRQTPDVRFVAGRGAETMPFVRSIVIPDKPVSNVANANAPIGVSILGGNPSILDGFSGIELAASDKADFVWDIASGDVVNRKLADTVAQNITSAAGFAGVAEKWRALPILYALMAKKPLVVKVGPDGSGKRYAVGSLVAFSAEQPSSKELKYYTAFNLAGNGNVEVQFPERAQERGPQPDGFSLQFASKVQPPLGADHLVVIATASEPKALRDALSGLNNKPAAVDALRAVQETVKGQPYAIGIAPLYTGP